jgi:MerR family transcriptional regulator, light-induced transcriptional regulator
MNADVLSTRQVATLLGVGEATVKRWADAGEIDCFRTPGGHRKFRLRDVTAFVHRRQYQAAGPVPEALPQGADELGSEAVQHFQSAALRGDAPALVGQLAALRLRGHSLAALFDEVAAPALQGVGDKWAQSILSTADEHIASQAVIDAVARAQPLAEPPGEPVRPDRGTAVVAAVAGELHDIAARMAACLLRAQGFEVLAPLAQTPARDLADLILRARAALVVLSSTVHPDVGEQVALAAAAARQAGGRVMVGGAAMQKAKLPSEARLLRTLQELELESQSAGRKRARA